MSSIPDLKTNSTDKKPSEYSRALTLKRKLDLAIRDKELEQVSHNIRAVVDGQESNKSYWKGIGRSAVAGGVAGAAAGGIAAVPLTIAKTPFRSIRNKPLGMAAVGTGTVLGALGFGAKRAKEGKRTIFPRRSSPQLTQLRQIRSDLKNTESPVYHTYVKQQRNLNIK